MTRAAPTSRESGQGLTEFLGLVLIVATSLAVGLSLLPSSEIPELARNGYKQAVCKTSQVVDCDEEDVTATSDDDNGGSDDGGDDGTTQPTEDEDEDGGDDDGGFLDGLGDAISDGGNALWEGTKQVGGVFKGIGEQGVDTVTGLWDTVTNPGAAWEGVKQLVKDPGGSLATIWDETTKPIVDDWKNGNYGEAIGRGIFSVAEVVFGGKGLTKLGKASKVVPDKPKTDKPGDDNGNNDDDTGKDDKDDEPGVTCPRNWRGTPGRIGDGTTGTGHVDLYAAPGGVGCPDPARRAELNRLIDDARNSTDPAKRDEGDAADAIRDNVWDFDRKVGPNGSTGQVDIETEKAIIEVTRGRADGKYKQTTDTLQKPEVNPDGKPVILYIKPGKKKPPSQRIRDLEAAGVKVVRNDDELKQALRDVGETVP